MSAQLSLLITVHCIYLSCLPNMLTREYLLFALYVMYKRGKNKNPHSMGRDITTPQLDEWICMAILTTRSRSRDEVFCNPICGLNLSFACFLQFRQPYDCLV